MSPEYIDAQRSVYWEPVTPTLACASIARIGSSWNAEGLVPSRLWSGNFQHCWVGLKLRRTSGSPAMMMPPLTTPLRMS